MKKEIITFINNKYMSMSYTDLVLKILSYFAYSYIMVIPTTFVIFDVQKYGFDYVSFFDERIIPIIFTATVLSAMMGIVSVIIYRNKSKWSTILLRGLTYSYISFTSFFLSCFNDFELSIVNICGIIIKLLIFVACIILYKNYLFKKKLPNIDAIVHGQTSGFSAAFMAPALLVFTKPLLTILFRDTFTLSFNWLVSATEFILAVGLIINIVDAFTKAYYAKKYSL